MNNLIFLVAYILIIYFGFNIRNAGKKLNSKELISAGKVWLLTVGVLTLTSLYGYFSSILELCTSSDLAGKKKDKWAKIFRAENQITLDNKKRVINCQSGDEKKALISNSKNSGTQAMFNFKTGKGKKNKFIGVVVK